MEIIIFSKQYGKKIITVDTEDYDKIKNYKWSVNKDGNTFYAHAYGRKINNSKTLIMHRFILDAKKNNMIDHINGNGLDNRKTNLRECTKSQNGYNRTCQKYGISSDYKGVCYSKKDQKYTVRIGIDGKRISLGNYDTDDQAAIAYNVACIKYHAEFARPNLNIMMHKGVN